MRLYIFLSKFALLKSYKRKLMLIAFIGIHIPLLTLLVFLVRSISLSVGTKLTILCVTTLSTLMGAAATLLAINSLLQPIAKTTRALERYWKIQALPTLPTNYPDEVGRLMANAYKTIYEVDGLIHYVADYDRLTGIPNRTFFKSQLVKEASRLTPGENIVVFLIDIDGFKAINTIGSNELGDRILIAIAKRLTHYVNKTDRIARLGSDEFAFFIKSSIAVEGYLTVAKTLQRQLSAPYFSQSSTPIHLTTSIGIAAYPADSTLPEQLIDYAYNALEQAQNIGKSSCQRYSTEIARRLENKSHLIEDLGKAIERNQLVLHYQPRVDWRDNKLVGVECLLRWQHPERGLIPPNQFIPLAEETGDILPIGEWVLRHACQQKKRWESHAKESYFGERRQDALIKEIEPKEVGRKDIGLPNFKLAVNLSVRQIEAPGLVDMIQSILDETQLLPRRD